MFAGLERVKADPAVGPGDMSTGLAQLDHRARASGRETCSPASRSSTARGRRAGRPGAASLAQLAGLAQLDHAPTGRHLLTGAGPHEVEYLALEEFT